LVKIECKFCIKAAHFEVKDILLGRLDEVYDVDSEEGKKKFKISE
jgi:hypothetical protein